jgi:hypothetical protein
MIQNAIHRFQKFDDWKIDEFHIASQDPSDKRYNAGIVPKDCEMLNKKANLTNSVDPIIKMTIYDVKINDVS